METLERNFLGLPKQAPRDRSVAGSGLDPLGRDWLRMERRPTEGREIFHSALRDALEQGQSQFSQQVCVYACSY